VTVVDTDSALLQLPDHVEDKIPLHADHSAIVKFDARGSHGYRSALDKLEQFERDAATVVAARFGTFDVTSTKRIQDQFGMHEPQAYPRTEDKASSHRRYFLLDEPCPASEVPRMMCRVVTDKYLPLFEFAPLDPLTLADKSLKPEPPHNASDIIPGIFPKPSKTMNRKDFTSAIRDRSLQAAISTVFGLDVGLEKEQAKLEAKEVRRYVISNPGQVFKILMTNALYARDVRNLLKETSFGKAYLVVGFLTTSGALWSRTGSHRRKVGGTLTVPPTAVAGALPRIMGLEQVSPDEEIFAVAYAEVKLKFSLDGAKIKRKTVLGPAKRAKAGHLAFSRDDSDDSETN
jgi:hypothetical protein